VTFPKRPHGLAEVVATFGDPLEHLNDKAAWEREALVSLHLPRPLVYAYDESRFVTRVRAHRLIAQHLVDTLMACFDAGVPSDRLRYGGCYVWRAMRGASRLSLHTWGIAVDLEPAENPLGKPWRDDGKMLHPLIVEVFENHGWYWGNHFRSRADAQHWQWCTGA
jgi:hypothetical protein